MRSGRGGSEGSVCSAALLASLALRGSAGFHRCWLLTSLGTDVLKVW